MTSIGFFDRGFRLSNLRFIAVTTALILLGSSAAMAQSTFGTVLGTVRDASGAVVAKCAIAVDNTGTDAHRATLSDATGNYSIPNLEPGVYKITMTAAGFQPFIAQVTLTARETARLDGQMAVAGQAQSVSVVSEGAAVVNTDVSNLAETKTGRELVDLPVAIATRTSGSTSPISTLTSQPGVQTDASGNISVAGTKPTMLSASIDGISSTGARAASGTAGGPIAEMFPSFNSIEEIRVSEVNNAAEYGGISDITTISKSGTNTYHGGAFENIQNTVMDARNEFASTKPIVKLNDFGAYGGGKIWKDKTFFFASYEGLRLPKTSPIDESVPSLALRSGDLSAYSTPVNMPGTGTPFPNNQIPPSLISSVSANVLKYLFPLPNAGSPNAISNNFVENIATPITSNQADLRLDHNISSKMTIFARGTYKIRSSETVPSGTPLEGAFTQPEIDFGYTIAFNWIIRPNLINETRGGFNGNHSGQSVSDIGSAAYVNEIGLQNLPQPYPSSGAVPWFNIAGFQNTGNSNTNSTKSRNGTSQIIDNVTWIKGSHTMKFGADARYLVYHGQNVYDAYELGEYAFSGAVTGTLGAKNAYIGNPYGAFLLGIPDKTYLDTNTLGAIDGWDPAYAFFAQDDWKATSRLTLNFGLRYELHPRFYDHDSNISNFLPDYQSIVNGQSIQGAVVIPNSGLSILSPAFAQSIAPTPILLAWQAGLSNNLHITNKLDFAPRFGFAYRLTNDSKTVLRGGYGKFIEIPLGTLLGAGWAIHSADQAFFNNTINANGTPALTFPSPYPSNLAVSGSQFFQQASDLHYPEGIVQQWNLTLERDLGFNTGLRVSYDGNHASNLGVQVNLGQLPPNTLGFNNATSLLKYPLFGEVESEVGGGIQNYDAFTVSLNKRFSGGLQFLTTYTFARNLTDAQGFNPSGFASEAGGNATDLNNFRLDYGNVAFTRRNRFLATFLYDMPFGKGRLSAGPIGNQIIKGWELAGVVLVQSGPFLTVSVPGADPAGVGFPQIEGNGRADIVSGVSVYPTNQSISEWLNPAAFAVPPNNIGRFPDSPVGVAQGPGTKSVSMSLLKTISIREKYRIQLGAQAANLFNHANYSPPNTTFNTSAFGTITSLQVAEGAGPRTIQGTFRVSF